MGSVRTGLGGLGTKKGEDWVVGVGGERGVRMKWDSVWGENVDVG